jgi:HAD superfamily hydrolase (TIGR01450 family)
MFDAILLDMDGVLYHGDRPLPEAAKFLERIRSIPQLFITNNPILPPQAVADKLSRMGLPRPQPQQIITSAQATARWLSREKPGFRHFAVGAEGLHLALREAGVEDPEKADFVVVGEGPGLDYASLTLGINLIVKQGARLVATNPDVNVDATVDGEHRLVPGGGALVAPFAVASGVEPVVIGKPNPLLFEMALDQLGCVAERCLMIGDRPDTDIAGAARLGLQTALVRTGRFAPGEPWPEDLPRPDWDVESLPQLLQQFVGRSKA